MIVVTGGSGFIGSALVGRLNARGIADILVVDHLGESEKWKNLVPLRFDDYLDRQEFIVRLERGDFGDAIDAVLHLGACSSTTERDADFLLENNYRYTARIAAWREAHPACRLIYASSAATYGDGASGFTDFESVEDLATLRPLNAYGWSKHLFDRWVARQPVDAKPPQSAGLKFFNVYGPNEYHKGTMRSVVEQVFPFAQRDEAFPLFKSHNPKYPDGGQLRDFVWVGDCVAVMLWLFDHAEVSGLFNLGTGKARSFHDLASAVYKAAGKTPQITYRDMPEEIRAKYQYFTEANMTKLRTAGYAALFTSLEDGVRMYVQDYLVKEDRYV